MVLLFMIMIIIFIMIMLLLLALHKCTHIYLLHQVQCIQAYSIEQSERGELELNLERWKFSWMI
jgi:hypothetical protein